MISKTQKMKCLTQKESWSCGLLSWASLLRLSPKELIKLLPQTAKNQIKVYKLAEKYGIDTSGGLDMDDFLPVAQSLLNGTILHYIYGLSYKKVKELVTGKEGIFIYTIPPKHEQGHAVAWNGRKILDSASGIRNLRMIFKETPRAFYTLYPLKATDVVKIDNKVKEQRKNAKKRKKTKR